MAGREEGVAVEEEAGGRGGRRADQRLLEQGTVEEKGVGRLLLLLHVED